MCYVIGVERNQSMLLPETVEEYVGENHPVRAIDAFVGALDLAGLGFAKSRPATTGRPPYDPGDLLRLYLWGYLNRVASSRRLEVECGRNLEVIWLLRCLAPDFKTIADFRRDNAVALKGTFRQFTFLCRELGLYGRELVAIDGTKLKASNNPAKRASAEQLEKTLAEIDERIAGYLVEAESADTDLLGEPLAATQPVAGLKKKLAALRERQARYQEALAVAQASGEKAPLIDPQCQSLKKVGLGYNAQVAVDEKNHLIVVAEIARQPTDHAQLPVVAKQVRAILESPETKFTADAGYHDRGALAEAEEAELLTFVPRPKKGSATQAGTYHKSAFSYQAESDAYRCPAGQVLKRKGSYQKHGDVTFSYSNAEACRACPLKSRCTKSAYRRIERWEKEAVIESIEARVAAHPELIKKRKAIVEHPFGTIKFWRGQGALLTRGRRQVQAELSLSALAYNLTRVLALLGVAGLIAAITANKESLRARFSALAGFLGSSRGHSQSMARLRALFCLSPRPLAHAA